MNNIYIPPVKSPDSTTTTPTPREKKSQISTEKWPITPSDCLFGDFNAHSEIWSDKVADDEINQNTRGEMIEDWLSKVDMVCLNDSSKTTWTSRNTTKNISNSSLDISFVHSSMADLFSWKVISNTLGSDHNPILVTYDDSFAIPKINTKPRYKWKLKGADWEKFTASTERGAVNIVDGSVSEMEDQVQKCITEAANKHVGKKKVTTNTKPWLSEEIKENIKQRNALKSNMSTNRKAWVEACAQVKDKVKEEKKKLWKEYVESLDMSTDPSKVWQTIRNMDGRNIPPRKNEALVVDNKALIDDKDKANAFAKTYRSFSKLKARKIDRALRHIV